MTSPALTVTVAVSDRGNYHLSPKASGDLHPICGAKAVQRETSITVSQFTSNVTISFYCSKCWYSRSSWVRRDAWGDLIADTNQEKTL